MLLIILCIRSLKSRNNFNFNFLILVSWPEEFYKAKNYESFQTQTNNQNDVKQMIDDKQNYEVQGTILILWHKFWGVSIMKLQRLTTAK